MFYDLLIIEEKTEKSIYIASRGETKNQDTAISDLEKEIKECSSYKKPEKNSSLAEFIPNFTIANMTQQLTIKSEKSPYEVYRYLRTHNPSPFGGFFQGDTFQVVCASPERFLKVTDGCIETRPIKGTRKRGETPVEDRILKEELKNSSKDRSELLMIVDLERNDLNHVCEPGSVKVTEHFAVETYSTVFHLVTTICILVLWVIFLLMEIVILILLSVLPFTKIINTISVSAEELHVNQI